MTKVMSLYQHSLSTHNISPQTVRLSSIISYVKLDKGMLVCIERL